MPNNEEQIKKSHKKKIIKTAIISIFTVLVIAVLCILIVYILWKNGFFIPGYVTWNNQSNTFIIEKDNRNQKGNNAADNTFGNKDVSYETVDFSLKKKKLRITDHDTERLLYESPKEWLISDYFFEDIDADGTNEVVLMVWKQGSFGEHKPFWHEGKDNKWTQHIFIYEWDSERNDRLDPKWMSSGLGIKVHKVFIDEKNRVHFVDDKGEETVWQWLGWGLALVEVIK